MKLKRFVVEAVLDRSFFERIKNRKVFRYRTESVYRTFFARSVRNAKRLAAKYLSRLLKERKERSIVTAYFHRQTAIADHILFPKPKRKRHIPSH